MRKHCEKVDFLINNAAVSTFSDRKLNELGWEIHMAVNYLGHFYLTHLLFGLLRKSEEMRIINVSSEIYTKSKLEIDNLHLERGYKSMLAYANSKLANIYFTRLLQEKINDADIDGLVVCLHPGVVRSELGRNLPLIAKILLVPAQVIFAPLFFCLIKSGLSGAQTTLYTVLEDK